MGNLTKEESGMKRIALLRYIKKCRDESHYIPSVREMSRAVGLSCSTVHGYLKSMQESGYVATTEGVTRSTVLTEEGEALIR